MAALSNYAENKVLDHLTGRAAWTAPTNTYLALFTTDPTDADSGTEATGGSYARQAVTFGAASGGTISNSAAVTFTSMPAGTFTHFGLYDADTAGNLLVHGSLTAFKTTGAGDTIEFAIGDLDITAA